MTRFDQVDPDGVTTSADAGRSSAAVRGGTAGDVGTPWLPPPDELDGVVRVLLVEDQQIYLAGLRALLNRDAGIEVVGEVDNVEAACGYVGATVEDTDASSYAEAQPRVVAVVRQGLLSSPDYEPLRELCCRGAAVLVLAESESAADLVRALRAGARGYLSRRLTAHQLLDGVRALSRDEPAFDSLVARQIVSYMTDEPRTEATPSVQRLTEQLTQRQRAVALLVAEGLSNEEIAARLHVSQATVKSHLGAMMRRLDVRSRTQLAILVNRKEDLPA
jgi:DNA-binding NarL/FixJ family response regulator